MRDIKKILCPVDYSVCSQEAFKYAVHIARTESAKLYLMHVIDVRSFGHESALDFNVPKPGDDAIKHIKEELSKKAADEVKGVDIETVVVVGVPVNDIVDTAKEKDVDLIVLGTHGRTGIPHLIIGSVAENVVRRAPCAVLTVRHA
ncbi:MAG: universal stress protein [Candidatus Brocadiales bacterium]|nr:universal stress protein [Candidatus Bathyanammoxibius amoris]